MTFQLISFSHLFDRKLSCSYNKFKMFGKTCKTFIAKKNYNIS